MKLRKTTKIIAGALAIASFIAINPIGANAAWRQNNTGWWYTEGSSWATGWRLIDGKWYYFYSDGYMAHDTIIDGYYVDFNGAWVNNSLTSAEAENLVKQYVYNYYGQTPYSVECIHDGGDTYTVMCSDLIGYRLVASGYYHVNKATRQVTYWNIANGL